MMHEGLISYLRTLSVVCLLALTACPVTVPPPTARVHENPDSISPDALSNIAPEQVFSSFAPHFADFNGDGNLDLLIGSKQGGTGFSVELGDGKGHWHDQPGPPSYLQPHDIAVGDVNRDGNKEVLIGGEGLQKGLQVWSLDKQGVWHLYSYVETDGIYRGVALQDVNGDGWLDVIAAGMKSKEYSGGVRIWLNNRKGGWLQSVGLANEGNYTGLAVADLNGDGHPDIVASALDGLGTLRTRISRYTQVGGVQVWMGDGKGHCALRMLPVDGGCESVSVADVNEDGRPDIAAGLYLNGIRLWLSDGENGWNKQEVTTTGTWGSIRFDDVDGSGLKELIAASRDGAGLGVWRWGTSGLFGGGSGERVGGLLPEHGVYFGMDVGDIFADGQMQVAVARADGGVEVWSKRLPEALPEGQGAQPEPRGKHVDLYDVSENTVFKTVDGVTEYRIGPGDLVNITMWQGDRPTVYKLLVQADGTISLPYFDGAKIDGMTAPEADAYLTKELARYLRHPRVDVLVIKQGSKSVKVFGAGAGAAQNPSGGTYYLTGRETLVDLMSRLGSPAKDADFTRVRLVRNGKTTVLNVQRAIRQGDMSQNAVLDDGDTVDIPSLDESTRYVYVLGEVVKPRRLPYNGELTILDAVSACEGFTANAYYPDIRLVRTNRETPVVYAIAMDRLLKQGDVSQNMVLEDKDIIIIPADPITNWNRFVDKMLPTISKLSSGIYSTNFLRSQLKNTTNANVIVNTGG